MKSMIARTVALALALGFAAAAPLANAEPQNCGQTVGESVNAYLTRHPDIKNSLSHKGQQESPGSPDPVLSYLQRHPDVREALITLSGQCV